MENPIENSFPFDFGMMGTGHRLGGGGASFLEMLTMDNQHHSLHPVYQHQLVGGGQDDLQMFENSPPPLSQDLRRFLYYVIREAGRDDNNSATVLEDLCHLERNDCVMRLREDQVRGYLQILDIDEKICHPSTHARQQRLNLYLDYTQKSHGHSDMIDFCNFNFDILEQYQPTETVMLIKMHYENWRKTFEMVDNLVTLLPNQPSILQVLQVTPYSDNSSESSISTDDEKKYKSFEQNIREMNSKNPDVIDECRQWFFYQISRYQVDCDSILDRLDELFDRFFKIRNSSQSEYSDLFGEDLGKEMHRNFQKLKRNYNKKVPQSPNKTKEVKKRKPRESRGLYLWQMILRLLEEPRVYERFIRWTNRANGEFEIIDSNKVSNLWGNTKNNPKMNYEKLSRSLRQYYNTSLMKKTNGKRLVYNFDMTNPQVQNFLSLCQKKLPPLCPSDDDSMDSNSILSSRY